MLTQGTYSYQATVRLPDGTLLSFTENSDHRTYSFPPTRYDVLVKNSGAWDLTIQRSRTVYHFSATGALLTVIDDYGNLQSWTYDGSGRPTRVTDVTSGRYLSFFYGGDGRISSIQDSASRSVSYHYDGTGLLTSVTDAAGRITSYSYSQPPPPVRFTPNLAQIRDNWNRVITAITYDASDRTTSYTEEGEKYTYTYHAGVEIDATPVTLKTSTQMCDSQPCQWTFTYGAFGFVTQEHTPDFSGHYAIQKYTVYNTDGSVQQTQEEGTPSAPGVITAYAYLPTGGYVRSVTRDYRGPNTGVVRFDYTYDTNFPMRVTAITPKNPSSGAVDPTWQAWKYDYYQAGSNAPSALYHVYRVEDNLTLDTVATYAYDTHGRVTKYTSATGAITDYAYDGQGNLLTVTGPANNDGGTRPVTTYGYDTVGRVTSVTDALGHQTTYAYDALDRITSVTLPKPSSGSALNFTTTYSYDNYDSGTMLLFTNVTDPNGNLTKQGYDQFGRLGKSIDALGNATSYSYQDQQQQHGLLESIADANGNVTSYDYDGMRRLTKTTFPDGAFESYVYYNDNTLLTKTDRKGQTIGYNYDTLKRVIQKCRPSPGQACSGPVASIAFTFTGQMLTKVVDTTLSPSETQTFAYDHSYRLASVVEGTRGTVNYQYNADDRVTNLAVSSGPTATYTYYADDSLNTIQWTPVAGTFKYAYTLPGQYQTVTMPSGATRNFSYDDQGRLTQISNVDPIAGNLATYAYGYDFDYTNGQYDRLGQRVSLTATVPRQGLNNHLFKYEYDTDYQLNKARYPSVAPFNGEVDSWTYDAIGNRLTSTVNLVTKTYTYQKISGNPNNWQRLLNDGTNAYTYDANGNTRTKTGYTFGWDFDNRMSSLSVGTTPAYTYTYDYQGRRGSKTVSGSTSTYLYDGLNLIEETGATPADYLFGPGIDEPIAMARSGVIYYYGVDGLGSANLVTNAAGVVQDSYLYDAWGQTRTQTGSLANPFGYTAREFGEAGTLFYRARYYQPSIGRFLSEEPGISTLGVFAQLYPYVGNSPVAYVDPDGEDRVPKGGPKPDWHGQCQNAPPLSPKDPRACHYGSLKFSLGFQSWDLDCICKTMPDAPGPNCARGCIQCAKDHGADVTRAEAHLWCKKKCRAEGTWTYQNDQQFSDAVNNTCTKCWFQYPHP